MRNIFGSLINIENGLEKQRPSFFFTLSLSSRLLPRANYMPDFLLHTEKKHFNSFT